MVEYKGKNIAIFLAAVYAAQYFIKPA